MCGRFFVLNSAPLQELFEAFSVDPKAFRFSEDIAPGSTISILRQGESGTIVDEATWWLQLDPSILKPDYRFSSFNSRFDKINQPRSISYRPYRETRCIIPASGFVEGLGDKKTYHQVELVDRAIAFGGIFKTWTDLQSGCIRHSTSIITLPGHNQWQNIHPKAFPLMLPWEDPAIMDLWLSKEFQEVRSFDPLLTPRITWPQKMTPIDRPSRRNPISASFIIDSE